MLCNNKLITNQLYLCNTTLIILMKIKTKQKIIKCYKFIKIIIKYIKQNLNQ